MNHPAPETDAPPGPGQYTIDELAARTGVPSRTIRFYQAKGVLPAPRKRGRVALYDDSHIERLQVVGELQDKGLRLRAIQDLVSRADLDRDAIHKWLGVSERLGSLVEDTPQLLTEEELKHHLGDPPPGVIARLVHKGAVQPQGEGLGRRYLVESPGLLSLCGRMNEAGIDVETAIHLHELLQQRFARAAEEVVEYAIKKVGRGFGRSAEPEDVMAALEAMFQGGVGAEAVRLIFIKELEHAVSAALHGRAPIPRRPGSSKRRR
jgi:DNA-binding transcriptional MerR regulator